MTLKESLFLSAAVGFFLIWAGELFKGIPLKESYMWVMFSIACLLYFQYQKNERLKGEEAEKKKLPTALPKRTVAKVAKTKKK